MTLTRFRTLKHQQCLILLVLVFQVISTAQIERLNLTPLVLIRDENGWAISPGVNGPEH